MEDILRQPMAWREKASEYWDRAKLETDYGIREQFAELAARYLDLAENFESQVVATAILNSRPKRRRDAKPRTSLSRAAAASAADAAAASGQSDGNSETA
jgi:hypothetical protein